MLFTAFLIGLFGSMHCVGMCGPIAWSLPNTSKTKWGYVFDKLFYNLGRTITYMAMGLLIGMVGLSIQLAGLQKGISILSGIFLIALVVIPIIKDQSVHILSLSTKWNVKLVGGIGKIYRNKTKGASFIIGLINGLLPCGLVYVAIAGAIAQRSVMESIAYMGLFGLGTIPLLFIMGVVGQVLSAPTRKRLNKFIPFFVLALGILFIIRGLNLGIPYLSPGIDNIFSSNEGPICH